MQNKEYILAMSNVYETYHALKEMTITKPDAAYQVDATISLFGQENHCHLEIKDEKLISSSCDCQWSKEYDICPHVQLVYREFIKQSKQELPFHYENEYHQMIEKRIQKSKRRYFLSQLSTEAEKSAAVLHNFQNRYQKQLKLSLQQTIYEIEPHLTYKDQTLQLGFRVGKEKKYVIKDIDDFLYQIEHNAEVSYGKALSFVHSEEAFDDQALAQISFMRKHKKVQREFYSTMLRTIPLKDTALDDFFQLYENESNLPFEIIINEEKPAVDIQVEGNYYIFSLRKRLNHWIAGKATACSVDDSSKKLQIQQGIYDSEGITTEFLSILNENDLVLKKEDYPTFYKTVILTTLPYLDMKPILINEEEPMEYARLYGDIDAVKGIFFYLYCYTESNTRYLGFDPTKITSYNQDLIEAYIKQYATNIEDQIVYMNEDAPSTIEFIQEGLPYLSQYCEIYVSEALKSIGKTQKYSFQVGIRYSNDLVALSISSDEVPSDELANVLSAYKRKKKFVRLKNGKLLSLASTELEDLTQFLNDYHISPQDLQKGKTTLEPYRMLSLDKQAENSEQLIFRREKNFQNYVNQFYEEKEYPLPKHYEPILRSYQKEGFQWLSLMRQYHFNGILADDMGLGKTLQVIVLLEANKGDEPNIVVCPSSLIYNWQDEVHKFSEQLSVCCITGNQNERSQLISHADNYDLLITSYDYIRRDIEQYLDITFDTVILDEAQYIKNQKTKNAICVKQLKSNHRLALTGTPIENSLAELWSIFDFLMPDYLFNYHYFQKNYETDIVRNKDEEKQAALRNLVSPFILRRVKKDVLKELPDKIEKVRLIEFREDEKKLYLANLAQVNKELGELSHIESADKFQILAMLTKLRQLCCEPRLLYDNITQLSSKLQDCIELIKELNENHQKVLLFSSFTSTLDLIAEELKRSQISYYQLTGKTNKEERKSLVDSFQTDDTSVFLISLKAGGTGLNLTAAEAVIHFDPWWNQSAQNQATDRAYRIGQTNKVQVFKMIMKDSIEEKILKLQEMKKELADTFVENNEGSISTMSKEEIMNLFTM